MTRRQVVRGKRQVLEPAAGTESAPLAVSRLATCRIFLPLPLPLLPSLPLLLLLPLASCSVNYSFTGGDVGQAKTFTVEAFQPRAPLATPTGAQLFTETLRDLLQAQTPLDQVRANADIRFEGEITGYDVQPVAIQANETAALNRLTMTVTVRYSNALDRSKNSEFSVSRFADYDSGQDLSTVEGTLVGEISRQLSQDIFDRTLGNW